MVVNRKECSNKFQNANLQVKIYGVFNTFHCLYKGFYYYKHMLSFTIYIYFIMFDFNNYLKLTSAIQISIVVCVCL